MKNLIAKRRELCYNGVGTIAFAGIPWRRRRVAAGTQMLPYSLTLRRACLRYFSTRCVLGDTAAHAAIQHCVVPNRGEESAMIVYRELSSLERDLEIPAKTLYAVSNCLGSHYRKTRIPKRGGGERTLTVSDEVLKKIQRRIADVLLSSMPVSRYAMAYRPGADILKNAAPHVGQPVVLKLDILHFFDSIRYSDVKEKAFPGEIYSEQNRVLLAMLCYYQNSLPQGAPSSPVITNILMREFDEQLGAWCRERDIAYTRYCDDMTFSGAFDPKEVIAFVRQELKTRGFLLNGQKTRIQRAGQRQSVTGIVVNVKPGIPREYLRKLRQELYYCRKYGIREHLTRTEQEITEEVYAARLLGQVQYVLQISPEKEEMRKARDWLLKMLRD